MKKRILIVLAILVLFSLTALAACDTHEHEYSWKSDANGHWQECACGDDTDKVAHVDDNADGKCDTCGYNMHAHAYEWKSDSANHWEECACGDKKEAAPHVDVKNNQTQADGADGKCDVCALEVCAVTFDMQGHGQAVATQIIGKGGHAAAPVAPTDDDAWKFGGWYKEAACENAFDFATETITEATTVYAKWTEDATEGASKAHAYILTLDAENNKAISKDQVVYFAYTAQENGRYTVSLGSGLNSQKCTFTTDKTEGTYNADNDKVNIDLAKDETVYIMLTCAEELSADAMACVMIANCVGGDALPADLFISGEYSDGSSFSFELDRDDMYVLYNDISYKAYYIGGEYNNKLVVVRSLGERDEVWTITPNADGSYKLVIVGATTTTRTLNYVESQAPIALSQIVGYYEPKNYTGSGNTDPDNPGIERDDDKEAPTVGSGITNGIIELYIYASNSETNTFVRLKLKDGSNIFYSGLYSATYNVAKNVLTIEYNDINVSLNIAEDGSVESINVSNSSTSNVYVRKGNAGAVPPASLPLEQNEEYRGETHTIRTPNDSQLFGAEGNNGITVMDCTDDVYTIAVNTNSSFTTYKLTISQEGEIKLYEADGTTLLDTLTKHEGAIKQITLAASAEGSTTALTRDDFYQGLLYVKVTTAGWYEVTGIVQGVVLYANVLENELEDYWTYGKITDGVAIYLEQDTTIVISCSNDVSEVALVVKTTDAPKGMSEDDAYDYEEGLTINNFGTADEYYVKYTPTADGTYSVCAFYLFEDYEDGLLIYRRGYICYTIDSVEYGLVGGIWAGGTSAKKPFAVIEVTEGQEVIIKLSRPNDYGDTEDIMVEIAEYVPVEEEKKEIFTKDQVGIYKGKGVSFDNPEDVTLKFDRFGVGTFTMLYGTFDIEITEDDGVYSFLYNDGYNSATFTFNNGNIVLDDEMIYFDEPFTLVKEAAKLAGTYIGMGIIDDEEIEITLTIKDDLSGEYDVEYDDNYEITISFDEETNTYSFTYGEDWMATNVTFTIDDALTLAVNDEFYGEFLAAK